jgi:hypothetical protein
MGLFGNHSKDELALTGPSPSFSLVKANVGSAPKQGRLVHFLGAAYSRISHWRGTRHFGVLLFFAGLASVITISNLGTTQDFFGYDAGTSMLVPATTVRQLAAWSDLYAPGVPVGAAALSSLWVGLAYLMSLLGASSVLIERLFYGLLLFGALFSSYLLSTTVLTNLFGFRRSQSTFFAGLIGSCWYTFNPYSMLLMTRPVTTHEIAWAVVPLGLTVLIKGLSGKRPFAYGLGFAATWLTIMTGNPALTLVAVILAAIIVGVVVAKNGFPSLAGWRFLGCSVILTVALGAYVWFPLLLSGVNPFGYASKINALSVTTVDAERFNSLRTSIANLWRTDGSIAFPEQPYYHLVESGGPWLFAGYFSPLAAFASIFLVRAKDRRLVFTLVITALIFMFLAKGEHDPFPQPMIWLYGHVGAFAIFRNSHDKFMLATLVIEGVLLSISFASLFSRALNVRIAAGVFAIGLVIPFALLFVAGRVADHKYLSSVPADYQTLRQVLAQPGSAGTVFTGPDFGGASYLRWYQGNQSPDPTFLGVPAVTEQWLRSIGYDFQVDDRDTYIRQFDESLDLLPLLGVRYVLIHKDVLPTIPTGDHDHPIFAQTHGQVEALNMLDTIANRPDLRRLMSNNYFELYVYCGSAVRPDVYATRSIRVGDRVDAASSSKDQKCASDHSPIFVPSNAQSFLAVNTSNESNPVSLAVRASAPGYRLLHVQYSAAPFILALSQTYDPQWTANVVSSPSSPMLPLGPLQGHETAAHAIADGSVNAWLITQTGDYWLTLVYRPQGLLIIGAWLSAGFAMLIILGELSWALASRRAKRRARR